MNAFISFLYENSIYIAIIIVIITSLLVYISFNSIDLNKIPQKKLIQTVTVETFGNGASVNNNSVNSNLDIDQIQSDVQSKYAVYNPGSGTDSTQTIDFDGAKSFCENYRGNSGELNKACSGLTNDNCKSSECCVLVQGSNGNKCMAGNIKGPTFKKDADGNLISMDAYYYQGQRIAGAAASPTLM